MPGITVRFNAGALHTSTWEMVLRNGRRRFRWAVIESLGLEIGDFDFGGYKSDEAFGVADVNLDLGFFEMEDDFEKVGGGRGWVWWRLWDGL